MNGEKSNKIRIMAIETSGRLGSVAVAEGPKLLVDQFFSGKQQHTKELLPTMAKLCREVRWRPSDIEQLYVSAGPGSITGLRVGISAAKALGFAHDTKIVAVPSMEVVVLNIHEYRREHRQDVKNVAVVLDAKRKQVYSAVFEYVSEHGFKVIMSAKVMKPSELLECTNRPLYIMGEGVRFHAEALTSEGVVFLPEEYKEARAANVHKCGWLRAKAGEFTESKLLTPIYLRRPEAAEKWEELHGGKS